MDLKYNQMNNYENFIHVWFFDLMKNYQVQNIKYYYSQINEDCFKISLNTVPFWWCLSLKTFQLPLTKRIWAADQPPVEEESEGCRKGCGCHNVASFWFMDDEIKRKNEFMHSPNFLDIVNTYLYATTHIF